MHKIRDSDTSRHLAVLISMQLQTSNLSTVEHVTLLLYGKPNFL